MEERKQFNNSELKKRIREAIMSELQGGSFWDDFKSTISPFTGIAKMVLPMVAPGLGSVASAGLSAIGLGLGHGVDPVAPKFKTNKMKAGTARYQEFIDNYKDIHLNPSAALLSGEGLCGGKLRKRVEHSSVVVHNDLVKTKKAVKKHLEHKLGGELEVVSKKKKAKVVKAKRAPSEWLLLVKKKLLSHPGNLKKAIEAAKLEYNK